MNLIDAYRYLAALEQHRHFGRAAAACHITQPALSNALRSLETHLGVAIVRRSRQYEGLTAEGEQVLATAHRVLREQEALQQALAGTVEQPQGRLLVAAVPTAVPVAARFVARLVALHPGLQPQLRALASPDIDAGLGSLAIDLGLGYLDRLPTTGRARPDTWPQYAEHHYLLAHHAGQPGGLGAPLAWAEAAAAPLALLTPEMHHRALVDEAFRRVGVAVQPRLECSSVTALLAAVQTGTLQAVLPGAVVATVAGQAGWLARPLQAPVVHTPMGFMAAAGARRSRALHAALRLAEAPAWQAELARHSGALGGGFGLVSGANEAPGRS
ncbi:MAG: LysR substrate-binding domain-containing protein [Rubrivivax sp.]